MEQHRLQNFAEGMQNGYMIVVILDLVRAVLREGNWLYAGSGTVLHIYYAASNKQ